MTAAHTFWVRVAVKMAQQLADTEEEECGRAAPVVATTAGLDACRTRGADGGTGRMERRMRRARAQLLLLRCS